MLIYILYNQYNFLLNSWLKNIIIIKNNNNIEICIVEEVCSLPIKKNTSVFFIQLQRLIQTYNVKYFIKVVNGFVEELSQKFHLVFYKIQVYLFLYIIQINHFFEVPNNSCSCKCGRVHFDDISHVHSFEDTALPNKHQIMNI